MKKTLLTILSNFVKVMFGGLICILAFVVISSRISGHEPSMLGYQVKSVLSGSMEPTFQTGSIISIKLHTNQTSYQKNDIITFRIKEKLITHRIIEIKNKNGVITYKTKGDNNNSADLWTVTKQDIVGKYTGFTIPYLGYALNYANSKIGSSLLLIIPGILLITSAIYSIGSAKKELEQTAKA
ncbi:signal peptidase I SipW [Gottfriedia sp. S16(2024)]|uniref:signal peptidase I SipW n=1 Tax=Gottfriedia sp. S16(2024) TaxID=3162883 RepID=UPI003D1B5903